MPTLLRSPTTRFATPRLGGALALTACACALTFCIAVQPSLPAASGPGLGTHGNAGPSPRRDAKAGRDGQSRWEEYWMEVSRATETP